MNILDSIMDTGNGAAVSALSVSEISATSNYTHAMFSSRRGCRLDQPFVAALAIAVASVTAACGARSINQLLADPAKYRNQSVTVRGTVAESASIAGRGAYRITDGDQGLWVVTTAGAPRRGARVDVTGRLEDGYDLGAFGNLIKLPNSLQTGLVLVESSHKAR